MQVIIIKSLQIKPAEMRSFAFATVLAAANAIDSLTLDYMNYMAKYGKQYDDMAEFNARKWNFAATDAFVKETNAS